MKALKILMILQVVGFIQGYDGLISEVRTNIRVDVKYVSQPNDPAGSCSWTLSASENRTSCIVKEDMYHLSSQICSSLGCGDVYKIIGEDAAVNSTCLTDCLYHNSELINCSERVRDDCRILSEVVCGSPSVARTSGSCTWIVKSPDRKSPFLTKDTVQILSSEICHQSGCGEVLSFTHSSVGSSGTCFTNCVYHDYHLRNCTEVFSHHCSVLSEIKCGNDAIRLVGGGHRCAGRVEVWRGSWGTVCDDEWDKEDAGVVCAQLGCGYAVSVSVQGGPYGQGSGPIHLDELNCTGREKNLWECPGLTHGHDCGHKEDAGVVCSEYKALRLTGGLDRCSGRVEVHRNGTWGTVCDPCWGKQEAVMACNMLNCGEAKQFTAFVIPFQHKNGTLWYFNCKRDNTNLWECTEYRNHLYACQDSKAAGLICSNSLGLPVPTSPEPTSIPATTVTTQVDDSPGFMLSTEFLACCVLGFLLLIAVIINIILCHNLKHKKAVVVQQRYVNLQATPEAEENNYRDSIHLVKLTNTCSDPEVSLNPQRIWPQSSVESGSYDTDYEQTDINPDTAFPLSTFKNSMRYSADGKAPSMKGSNLKSVTEEDSTLNGYQQIWVTDQQMPAPTASVDSFESSCTSSGECYENTGNDVKDLCSLESGECYGNMGEYRDGLPTADTLYQTNQENIKELVPGHTFHYQELDNADSSRADAPLYSPVTYDNEVESDYDDIGNYLQQPDQ